MLSVHVSMVATWSVGEVRVVVEHWMWLMVSHMLHMVVIWLLINILLLDHVCVVNNLMVWCTVVKCLVV